MAVSRYVYPKGNRLVLEFINLCIFDESYLSDFRMWKIFPICEYKPHQGSL